MSRAGSAGGGGGGMRKRKMGTQGEPLGDWFAGGVGQGAPCS